MKSFITPTYIFTPGLSGVGSINLSSIEKFDIKRLVAIINITNNIIIYNVASATTGFTTQNNGLIVLDYNTSAMSSNDLLQIIYDNDDAITNNELIQAIEAMRMAIQSLNKTIGLGQVNPLTGGLFIDGSRFTQPISGNLTTLITLNNLLQMGGQNTNSIPLSTERNAADNLRNNIKIT